MVRPLDHGVGQRRHLRAPGIHQHVGLDARWLAEHPHRGAQQMQGEGDRPQGVADGALLDEDVAPVGPDRLLDAPGPAGAVLTAEVVLEVGLDVVVPLR